MQVAFLGRRKRDAPRLTEGVSWRGICTRVNGPSVSNARYGLPSILERITHTQAASIVQASDMAPQNPIAAASVNFPKPADRTFQYGTAGVGYLRLHS